MTVNHRVAGSSPARAAGEFMENLTWLDLYDFLHRKANNIKKLDPDFWSQNVSIRDQIDKNHLIKLVYFIDEEGKKKVTFSTY